MIVRNDFSVLEETDSLKIYHRNISSQEDCGSAFDPKLEKFDLANFEVTNETRQLLVAIYLVVSLLGAILVALALDPLHSYPGVTDKDDSLSGVHLLLATCKQMKNPYQILIIPLTMWSGFEQTFLGADFTAVRSTLQYQIPVWEGISI